MKSILLLIFFIHGSVFPVSFLCTNFDISQDEFKTSYEIEGKTVSKDEFESFVSQLRRSEGTYQCAKTVGGGINSFEAEDENGNIWIYHSMTQKKFRSFSLSKK